MVLLLACHAPPAPPAEEADTDSDTDSDSDSDADSDSDSDTDSDADSDADSDSDADTDTGATSLPTFFDDFLVAPDPKVWRAMKRNWGGSEDGEDYNGGVRPELLSVEDGLLVLEAHGDRYKGLPLGIHRDGTDRDDGTRVGSGLATDAYFASGRYEIRARVAPELGVCTSFFSFHYQEFYPGEDGYKGPGPYTVVNHEVDIEIPGRSALTDYADIGFDKLLATSWVGVHADEFTVRFATLDQALDDGEFHLLRYDWHTDPKDPRVEWYVDDVLVATSTTTIPTHASRLYLAAWFPMTWAGTPDFEVAAMEVDWVSFTAFGESGDSSVAETYPDAGWAEPDEWPF